MDAMEHTGTQSYLPTTREIRHAFVAEIAALGGTVIDEYDDGDRLFLRAVLPPESDVRRGDAVRGGVAVRTAGPEILVHPYTFRQVCTNGAIHARALETRRVARPERADVPGDAPSYDDVVALAELGEAVRGCAAPHVFARGVEEMRAAAEIDADEALMLVPLLARHARLGDRSARELARQILGRFDAGPAPDRSAFGLMNAVTSLARDTRDPEARWRLEELGGAMPALLPRRPRVAPPAAALAGV